MTDAAGSLSIEVFDPPPDPPGGIEWVSAAAVLRVPNITPQSRVYWAEQFAGIEAARRQDALSALAFRAWRQRWWRAAEGRGRRQFHLVRAAAWQAMTAIDAFPESGWCPMPLGAARGVVRKASRSWEPGEARADRWLVTLPIYERVRGCLLAVDILAWEHGNPDRWNSATGAYDALGAEMALSLVADGEPVRIYANPATWNRAGGPGAPGCCVLDWGKPFAQDLLLSRSRLIADNRAHALELQRRIDAARPRVQFLIGRRREIPAAGYAATEKESLNAYREDMERDAAGRRPDHADERMGGNPRPPMAARYRQAGKTGETPAYAE